MTLAEDFAGAGYRTVSISSNPHLSPSFGLTRGFDDIVFDAIDEGFDDEARSTINDSADRVHQAALRWLDGLRPGEPAFLYLHTLNPHNPYTPPEPYPSRFVLSDDSSIDGSTKTLAAIRDRDRDVSPQDERRIREWYTAGVAYNDAALCGFVEELKRRFDSRFLLVVTSDHGEELFDHDGVLHGYTLYDELLHVPLVVWWPEAVRPTRVEAGERHSRPHRRAPGPCCAARHRKTRRWTGPVGSDRRCTVDRWRANSSFRDRAGSAAGGDGAFRALEAHCRCRGRDSAGGWAEEEGGLTTPSTSSI